MSNHGTGYQESECLLSVMDALAAVHNDDADVNYDDATVALSRMSGTELVDLQQACTELSKLCLEQTNINRKARA